MARIAGVNVPDNKHAEVALTAIFGIGRSTARKICDVNGVKRDVAIRNLAEPELEKLRKGVVNYTIEGDLRREVNLNVKRLRDLGCYRGVRHRRGLPVRGQRTRTNARGRKGPRRIIKNKR